MSNEVKIRPAPELREIINWVRAKCLLNGVKCPSITKVTEVIAKYADKERIFENEFFKK